MTKLEKAFAEASKLPKEEQELFASWILEEIASERQWTTRFAASHDRLSKLADEALEELSHGETEKLTPGEL